MINVNFLKLKLRYINFNISRKEELVNTETGEQSLLFL